MEGGGQQWLTRRRLIFAVVTLIVVAIGWWLCAYPRGVMAAWIDSARGHHEIKVYGLPAPWRSEYARLVYERYGVEINPVAGCVVSQELVWYVDGYNSVARQRILARHGKDIFAECAKEARADFEQAQPEE